MNTYDVTVFGAGPAGICAAIQAARLHCRVCLVEKTGLPGGAITLSSIPEPGLFFAWNGKQVISGIGWELVSASLESGSILPDFTKFSMDKHFHFQVPIDPFVFACNCENEFLKLGIDIKYHTMPGKVEKDLTDWRITLCGKDGLYDIKSKTVIDCTGDANVAKLAGYPLRTPEPCQPATYSVKFSGFDRDAIDHDELENNWRKAVQNGELLYTDTGWFNYFSASFFLFDRAGINANHICGINAYNSRNKTSLEIEGRASVLRALRFFRKQKGLENIKTELVSSECGVRESRTVKCLYTITVEDVMSGKLFPDSVCYAFYPVDLHDSVIGLDKRDLPPGVVPSVPLRALIPDRNDRFLVAGRIISSDRPANSLLRIQATCMATGQTAGAAAALSLQSDCPPAELDFNVLRTVLTDHGTIVPPMRG